jgi:hypothetical protein
MRLNQIKAPVHLSDDFYILKKSNFLFNIPYIRINEYSQFLFVIIFVINVRIYGYIGVFFHYPPI